jgi:hypothetical protein
MLFVQLFDLIDKAPSGELDTVSAHNSEPRFSVQNGGNTLLFSVQLTDLIDKPDGQSAAVAGAFERVQGGSGRLHALRYVLLNEVRQLHTSSTLTRAILQHLISSHSFTLLCIRVTPAPTPASIPSYTSYTTALHQPFHQF